MKTPVDRCHVWFCGAIIALERLAWYALLAGAVYDFAAHGLSEGNAQKAVGWLKGLAYALPVVFSVLSDRMGYRKAVAVGLALLTAGYAVLAGHQPLLAVALIAAGNGFFKPSLMSLLTGAYLSGSPERTRAAANLYRAINIGSLPAGILSGWALAVGGATWHRFALPLLTMLSAAILAWGWKRLKAGEWRTEIAAYLQTPTAEPAPAGSLLHPLLAVAALLVGATVFWTGYNLSDTGLALWIRDHVDRSVLGWTIPAHWLTGSVNPAWIILLGPVADWLGEEVDPETRRTRLNLPDRLALGMGLVAASFALLYVSGTSPLWVIAAYGLLSLGELLISAGAIAAISSWAPRGKSALFLSLWFLSISAGGVASGYLGATDNLRALFGGTAGAAVLGLLWFVLLRPVLAAQDARARGQQLPTDTRKAA